ncbi:MAG: STAS domain-containing protein, partial [Candidatus Sulfotelmatobacter sp.]
RRSVMAANPVIRNPELKLETEKKNSETTLRATGRITLATAAKLENTLRDLIPEGNCIVLDLTNVDYIDSAGLGALVSVYTHAIRAKCALEIANPKQRIKDLFDRSGLAPVFEGRSFDMLWEAWSRSSSEARD